MIDLTPIIGTKVYHPIRELENQFILLKKENNELKARLLAIETRKKPRKR
jgi:hypothetical protein